MIEAGYDQTWAEGDDLKVSCDINVVPFFKRGQ